MKVNMNTIKRLMVMAIIAIVSVGTAFAGPRFGIKLGMNVNKLHVSNWKDTFQPDNGCGFTGGVMTEFTLPIIGLGVDASLMYTRMSSDIEVNVNDENGNLIESRNSGGKNFFEIPINIKYKLGIIPVVSPYFFTGPSFAFKLGGGDDVFKTKTFQAAWNIGVGVEILKHVQVGASYGFGMNNVAEKFIGGNTTNDFKIKNNYWTITAAYLF